MNAHLKSALITFVATFFTTLGSLVLVVDLSNIDKSVIASIVISAINTALRASIKVAVTPTVGENDTK